MVQTSSIGSTACHRGIYGAKMGVDHRKEENNLRFVSLGSSKFI